jgi:tetratricopeptide (TPR) repeat protein
MPELTRDIVRDLWPLYAAGELSAATRVAIDDFLAADADFARRIRAHDVDEALKPIAVELPADHERATLLRLQRRRAGESMVINGLALLASAAMMAVYLVDVVPRWAAMFAGVGVALPGTARLLIAISNWLVRVAVPASVVVGLLYLLRRRLRVPEIVRSGTLLAIVTGVLLVLAQLSWLALLVETFSVVEDAYEVAGPAMRVSRAALAMRSDDHDAAVQHLETARRRLAEAGAPDTRLALATALMLGDAYTRRGDAAAARRHYEQALTILESNRLPAGELRDAAQLERAIRSAIDALASGGAVPPR